jgi:anti-sigma factor RsiW
VDCRDVQPLLHPYADGELDLVRHLQVEHHVAECAACAEREHGLRALREAVAAAPLYHRAPAGLRARVQANPVAPARRRRSSPALLTAIAAGLLVAGAGVIGLIGPRARLSLEDRLADQVTAGHVRSLQVAHATDVASSDRHTVKPWFLGKLDFSPQVPDLAADGFPLAGGRLDYLTDRPVAALVYHRREHVINVFTWPAADDEDRPVRTLRRNGFHLRSWQRAGMAYWAISDLNSEELDGFVRVLREHTAAASP